MAEAWVAFKVSDAHDQRVATGLRDTVRAFFDTGGTGGKLRGFRSAFTDSDATYLHVGFDEGYDLDALGGRLREVPDWSEPVTAVEFVSNEEMIKRFGDYLDDDTISIAHPAGISSGDILGAMPGNLSLCSCGGVDGVHYVPPDMDQHHWIVAPK